jgi:hypothetical protein
VKQYLITPSVNYVSKKFIKSAPVFKNYAEKIFTFKWFERSWSTDGMLHNIFDIVYLHFCKKKKKKKKIATIMLGPSAILTFFRQGI